MKRLWLAVLCVGSLLIVGCGKGNFSEQQKAASNGNIFRYPIVTSPTKLDPAMVQDGDTLDALQQVYEGLVVWSEDNKPVPCLADSWDISPDGKVYTFHLHKGVKFHNGREMVADDFKYAIERSSNPKLASPTAEDYLKDIVGVMDKLHGKATEVKGVQVIDKYTVKVTLDAPHAYFLGKLTYLVAAPVPKECFPPDKEVDKVENCVGTGPFKMTQYVPDQLLTMTAFKDYHGGAPLIDGIERPVIKDATTRLNKFKAGEVDLVQLERGDVKGVREDPKLKDQLKLFDRPAIWYVAFNLKMVPQFADKKVRQALSYAVDRDRIVNEVLGGVNTPANGILPPGVLAHRDKTAILGYDVAKAKQLLAEAGYPDGKGFPQLEMWFREQRPDIQFVAEAVAADLKKNLNIDVKLKTLEWGSYLAKNNAKEIPFFHMRWSADYLDPQNFLSLLLTTDGNENKTFYSNPQVDALCAKADSSLDEKERITLYAQAEDLILQDAAWIPVYFQRDAELISPRVSGLRESLFGHLPHTTVKLKP
ncbi:MAG: ABC transporter substrate-binding protein [Armatimonadetes bacterium]|nr:ABC transporter substrate-binding protein [Armatimonadota bacterium]